MFKTNYLNKKCLNGGVLCAINVLFQNSDLGQPAGLGVVVVGEVVYLVVDGAEVGVLGHPTVAADAADVAGGVVGVGGVVATFDAQGGEEDVVHGRHPVVGVVGEPCWFKSPRTSDVWPPGSSIFPSQLTPFPACWLKFPNFNPILLTSLT